MGLILLLLSTGPVRAGEAICRNPSVVEFMTLVLHEHDHYARLDPCFIEEYPTNTTNTVLCNVTVQTLTYNAQLQARRPLRRCERHLFRARALPNGFRVDYMN